MKQSSHFLILRDLPPLLSLSIYRIHTLSLARSTKILKVSLSCLLVFQHCPSQGFSPEVLRPQGGPRTETELGRLCK